MEQSTGRGRPRSYCATHKLERRREQRYGKTPCTLTGCEKRTVARGLCSTHYNQAHQNNRHTKTLVSCTACGKDTLTERRGSRYSGVYCDRQCAAEYRYRESNAAKKQVAIPGRYALGRYLARYPVPPTHARTWVAGNCRVCAKPYLCKYGSSTCGDECQARWWLALKSDGKQRRRAIKKAAFVANVYRADIYMRDGYTCQLCGDPMDMGAQVPNPHAPTIDHVIPLARGGTHEPANVQAAHFICNALKGDRYELAA